MKKLNYSFKKVDLFLLLFLGIIIAATIYCALNPNFGNYFSVRNWFTSSTLRKVSYWVAVGFTMIVCFFGALIPVPTPYIIPISLFSGIWYNTYGIRGAWYLILGLVVLAALANTIGNLITYLIGDGAQYIMKKQDPEAQNIWTKIILKHPKATPIVIFIFGLTPLPDSLLLIPLGIAKYDIKKTFIAMFLSRVIMMGVCALAGIFAIKWFFNEGTGQDPYGWISGIIILYIMWAIIVFMMKYKPKEKNQEAKVKVEEKNL